MKRFFLHYGWFLQNLGKYFIPTNMHTTADSSNLLLNPDLLEKQYSDSKVQQLLGN